LLAPPFFPFRPDKLEAFAVAALWRNKLSHSALRSSRLRLLQRGKLRFWAAEMVAALPVLKQKRGPKPAP
jgi:hypothetical protein